MPSFGICMTLLVIIMLKYMCASTSKNHFFAYILRLFVNSKALFYLVFLHSSVKRGKEHLDLTTLVAILNIALMKINDWPTVYDLIIWIREGYLPYQSKQLDMP